jgi:RNA polymerase sigma-70 factor (ECF subfamily)
MGLLALMRLHLARASARFAADGSIVLLKDQDRGGWDAATIADARQLLERAQRIGRAGPYQLQAAIVAVHAAAPRYADTDWAEIVALYDRLHAIHPSPVVALNRALAVAELEGPRAGLAAVEPLVDRLDGYHLFHAARGELLRRLGRNAEALEADRRALQLTDNPAEQRLLTDRIAAASA